MHTHLSTQSVTVNHMENHSSSVGTTVIPFNLSEANDLGLQLPFVRLARGAVNIVSRD